MKNKDLKKTKFPGIYIDESLEEKYAGKALFKEKVDEANRVLKTYGVPKSAQNLVEKNNKG